MIRIIFFILFVTLVTEAKINVKDLFNQIKESKTDLKNTDKERIVTNKQLQAIAAKIKKIKAEIEVYDKKIAELDTYLKNENKKYQDSMAEINGIDSMIKNLDEDIDNKTKEFARKLSMQLGTVVAQNRSGQKSEKSVVLKEVYSKYKNYSQQELLKLSRNIEQKKALKKNLLQRRNEIAKSIKDVKKQRELYKREKAKRKQLLNKLAMQERLYSKKLKEVFKKQTLIRLTLAKLNLLKEESAKEAKRKEQELKRRIAMLKRLKLNNKEATIDSVKQYSSSYMSTNIYKYRGPKTISPLKKAKIVKYFGTFIDPVYKIKSHNDSITLISLSSDKRVFNVLNGEVAYKGISPMLGKVVIVKHNNGLHTIYADLDKISPLIKVGSKLKKGAVVGKVKRKLIFEATKNGQFINPQRLINL